MLGLKLATDPRWANLAEKSLEEILSDHAWCEQKAAVSGISMIVRFSNRLDIVKEMTLLVAEEWGHFRKVLRELERRDLKFLPQRKDLYVIELQKVLRKGGSDEQQIVEQLLINAMIEARSCERFRVLSLYMEDEYLRKFYHEFMASEAGHYRTFLDLAKNYLPEEYVNKRWNEILNAEANILSGFEPKSTRVH